MRIRFTVLLLVFALTPPLRAQQPEEITLEQGLELAFRKNEILQIARGELERANRGVQVALSDGLPQVRATFNYNRNWQLPSTVFGGTRTVLGTKNNMTGTAVLRQSLYAGGEVAAGWREAKHFRDLTTESLRATRQRVHANVETAFYDLLLARELVHVSELAIERARQNLDQVRLLRQAGRASRFDLIRAEVQVLELRPDSIRAARDRDLADLTFKNVIGLDPAKPITPVGDFRPEAALGDSDSLLAASFDMRPDLRQAQHRILMRDQAVRAELAGRMPTIDAIVSGQLQVLKDSLNITSDDVRRSWFTGIAVNIPIFDGLRTRSRAAQARVDLRRAELEAQSLERAVRLDVHRAWLDFREARDRQDAQARALELTQEGLRMAQAQYAEGLATQLEVTDAQLSLLRAETEFARARRDRSTAQVNLERAVGTLGE